MFQSLRSFRVLILAVIASILAVLAGAVGLPGVVRAVSDERWDALAFFTLAAGLCIAGFLIALGFLVSSVLQDVLSRGLRGSGRLSWLGRLAVLARAVAVCLVVVLATGVLAGVWAMVFFWLGVGGSATGLRGVVDVLGLVCALAVAPVVFVLVLYGVAGYDVWSVSVLRVVRTAYFPLFLIALVSAGVGFGISWVTALLPGVWPIVARAALLALLGVVVLLTGVGVVRWSSAGARRRLSVWPGIYQGFLRVAPGATAGTVVAVSLALLMTLVPPQVAVAEPGDSAITQRPETTTPVGDVSNRVPDQVGSSAEVLRDPYDWYETPEAPGEVVDAGEGWVTYQTGARSFKTAVGGVSSTFVDDEGAVQLVDNTLVPDPETETLVNADNNFSVSIPVSGDGSGVRFERDGYWLVLTPSEGDFSRPLSKGNAVLFTNVFPGIHVQYTLIGQVVKEDIVVTRLVEVPKIHYTVSSGGGLTLDVESADSLTARAKVSRGSVVSGDAVFVLSAPAMMDAGGAFSDAVSMTTQVSGAEASVTVAVDQGWVADPVRVFPIRIDPVVEIAGQAVSMVGVEQGSPNTQVGDNGYPYAGYDDGITSKNLVLFGAMLMTSRIYTGINYDFQSIMREARIDSATLRLHHYTSWSNGSTVFDLYTVDQPWDSGKITWNSQLNVSGTYVGSAQANLSPGYVSWDVRSTVNDWVQGILPQYGFRVMAQDEHYAQAEVFSNKNSASPPELWINWSIPDPVPAGMSLDETTINVRPVTEKSQSGKQIVDGVFADGLATPDSWVSYVLNPTGTSASTQASRSYKFPNSSSWDAQLPDAGKYADKLSNWQTGLFGQLNPDVEYQFQASATLNGSTGAVAESDRFLIYKVQATDTLPFIAKWYGVPLATLMADNRVQDTLAQNGNTLFIRNPSTTEAYNTPSELTEEQMKQIDSNLMGRGLHCEYGYEPINMNTGNFWLSTTDVSIPEAQGAFGLTRSYNSLGDHVRSVFGFGWEFEYSQRLAHGDGGSLLWTSADGKTVTFTANGDGTYSGPAGFYLTVNDVPFTRDTLDLVRFDMTGADGSVAAFDGWGLLTSVTDSLGRVTALGYDADLNVSTVTSPSGAALTFSYDGNGRVLKVTRPDGVSVDYGYDAAGDLVSFTDGNGGVVMYAYDSHHRIVSWADQNGVTAVTNTFDELGRVTAQQDASGNTATLVYASGKTTATDARGNTTVYSLDGQGRTVGITYPDGYHVTRTYGVGNTLSSDEDGSYTWDGQGNRLSATDLNGNSTTWTYNGRGQATAISDADGVTSTAYSAAGDVVSVSSPSGTQSYTWDAQHRVTSHTDEKGATESWTYGGSSPTPMSRVDFTGGVWSMAYDPMRLITSTTDPLGNTTRWMYDQEGRQIGYQTGDGAYTQTVRDKVGNPVQTIDPLGFVTTVSYDAMRNIVAITDPKGDTTTRSYDRNGNLSIETNPLGVTTTNTYDKRDRLVGAVDGLGGQWFYAYDNRGNVVSVTDAAGATTTYTYDLGLGVRTSVTDPLGRVQSWTYTPTGKVTSSTDLTGAVTTYVFGADGRLAKMTEPGGKITDMAYDGAGNLVSVSVNGRQTVYVFDAGNHLVSSTDPAGNVAFYTYDAAGRALSVTNEAGETTAFGLDPLGRTLTVTDGESGAVSRTYDLAGNVLAVTDALGNTTSYVYDELNHLIAETDPLGAVTTYAYDAAENMTATTDPYGATTTYTYDALNRLTASTDALGRVTSYTTDAVGQVTAVTDPAGYTTTTSYNLAGQVTRTGQPNGLVENYTYDRGGRVTAVSNSLGATLSYGYDEASRVSQVTDPVGRIGTWTYDRDGNLVSSTSLDQVSTSYTYDVMGFATQAVSSASGAVLFDRDPMGRILKETDPLGAVTSYTYDRVGRVTSSTDALGAVTTYAYDAQGNQVSVTDALGQTTSYLYDALNRPVAVTDAAGGVTGYVFDALSRLSEQVRPEGDVTGYAYDAAGQLVSTTDAAGGVTSYTYEPRGLLESVADPLGAVTTQAYDAMGDLAVLTDPLGRATSYTYDQGRRMTQMTNPAGSTYAYTYDLADRLVSVASPLGLARSFTFDEAGNISMEKDSLGRVSMFRWDGLHNMVLSVDPLGAVTRFGYDKLGRLTTTTDDQRSKWTYDYDPVGNRVAETDPLNQVSTFAYDLLGQVKAAVTPSGATTSYSYDRQGNLAQVTDPLGHRVTYAYDSNRRLVSEADEVGSQVNYEWDDLDRITRVSDQLGAASLVAYDPVGNRTSVTDATGNATSYQYDGASQLTQTTDASGESWSYGYDALGNLASVTDPLARVTALTYDAESNLTSVTLPSGAVEKWTYDPASRLIGNVKPGGVGATYDWDALNRLVDVRYSSTDESNVAYGYDSLGRRVTMDDQTGQTRYEYDALGRMVSVAQADGREVSYTYTTDGRVASIGYPDGTQIDYAWDDDGNLIEVRDPSGTVVYTYDELDQVTGLTRPNGTTTSYTYDERGSVVQVANLGADGSLLSRFDYTYLDDGSIGTEVQTWTDADSGDLFDVTRVFTYDENQRLISYTETEPSPVVAVSNPAVLLSGSGATLTGSSSGAGSQTQTVTYTYDASGNRVKAVKTLPGKVTLETISYTYDDDDRLIASDSSLAGVTVYTYGADGTLLGADNTDTGLVSYEWTAAQRLQAVRAGGILLMAVSYDGDGNKVFQAEARPVYAEGIFVNTAGSVFSWRDDDVFASAAGVFWYGFAQGVAQQIGGLNGALSVAIMEDLSDGYATGHVVLPDDAGLNQSDADSLSHAGVAPDEVQDVVTSLQGGTVLPDSIARIAGYTWDLTHYVNDVNTAYTQVLAEYGPSGALTADYTYGVGRVNIRSTGASATTSWLAQDGAATGWYSSDGRGSVAGVTDITGSLVQEVSYDPWGVPAYRSGGTSSSMFGWNGEEYSSGTGLQFLRARWYEPSSGRFTSADTLFGDVTQAQSLNRYSYGRDDPVNTVDPSGHWPGWVKKAAKAVKKAAKAVNKAANVVNDKVIKPVVKAVSTAAKAVNDKVIKPVVKAVSTAAKWVNDKVIKPVVAKVTNAAQTVAHTAQTVYNDVKETAQNVVETVQAGYQAATTYIEQRAEEIKAQVIEFACTTADRISDAWQDVTQAVSSLPWGTIGQVALLVGGAALTIATLGAAGPVVGAIMVASLVVSTAVEINDMVADATGTNFIKDRLLGGNDTAYAILQGTSTALSFVGPGGALKAATKVDDVVDVVRAGDKAKDTLQTASAGNKTDNAVSSASTTNKADNATGGGSTASKANDRPTSCPVPRLKSFTGETLVLMGDETQKPIKDVVVGDQVMSFDPGTDTQTVETVTATWPHMDTVVNLTLSDGTVVETTDAHPWWIESERAYIRTDHLNKGDILLLPDGSALTVAEVSGPQGDQPVWNLSVTGPHTYYVSDAGVLVHNAGGGITEESCSTASPKDIVQQVAQQKAGQGKSVIDEALTPAQLEAIKKHPWLKPVYEGSIVHNQTAEELNVLFPGQFAYSGNIGVDFTHVPTGTKVELTTPGQVNAHMAKGGDYVTAEYATYTIPSAATAVGK